MKQIQWALVGAAAFLAACGTSDAVSGDIGPAPDTTIGDTGDVGVDGSDASEDSGPDGTPCTDNLDCRGGEVCREGFCREACSEDDPCSGADPVCEPEAGYCVECVVDGDCAEGTCVDNECFVDRCESDADCPNGLPCDEASGQCGVCGTDADCPGGFTCAAELCVPIDDLVCTPSSARCDGNDRIVCSRDGTAETRETCAEGLLCISGEGTAACLPVVCTPDEIGCLDGSTAFICDATGTGRTPLPCRADQYCDGGSCQLRTCEPSATVCEGDVLVECDALGASETFTACAAFDDCSANPLGCACVGAECLPRACVPGTGRCVGANVQRCTDDGLAYETPVACDGDELCVAGECLPSSCTVGETRCSGDTLLRCEAGNRWASTNCSASEQLCTTSGGASTCSARICEPLEASCIDIRTLGSCDARGAVLTEFACEEGQYCVGGSCAVIACDPRTCAEYGLGETRVDVDSDGIPDCTEGLTDSDGDGDPSCADSDADGDGVADAAEGTQQTDGDGVPDYLDRDSDGDGIGDLIEGDRSSDADSVPDRRDPDSDNDTVTDAVEAGRGGAIDADVVDSDGDGAPDYRDTDSDNDGLLDIEERGCPTSTSRTLADSDSDTWNDSLELALGSDACSTDETPEDLVDAVWRPAAVGATGNLVIPFVAPMVDRDIVYNVDTTGSMSVQISAVRSSATAVANAARLDTPDARFGVAQYEDYACSSGGFGSAGDVPFALLQRVTSSITAFANATTALALGSGGDLPESGYEALYQLATGAGLTGTGTCSTVTVPRFNNATGFVAGSADGSLGGAGFRSSAMPVIVTVTDAPNHEGPDVGAFAATATSATSALQTIGARTLSVLSTVSDAPTARTQLRALATATGAQVPTCAWGSSGARPVGCAVGTCCTGAAQAGQTAVAGQCPLVFETSATPTTTDIQTAVTTGLSLLARYGRYDIRARVVGDAGELAATGFDTATLVQSFTGGTATAPAGTCGVAPTGRDLDSDSTVEAFDEVAFGATIPWTVSLRFNPPGTASGNPYLVQLEIAGEAGIVVDRVSIMVVPP